MRSTLQFVTALFGLALLGAAPAAMAQATTTFNVRLIITQSCTLTAVAATDVDFGSALADSTTALNAQGSVTARCSVTTPYNIALNAGSNAGTANDVTTRRMRNTDAAVTTNNFVAYQLYRDAGRSQVWGATTSTNTVPGTGTGLNQTYPVYGQVANPSLNNATPGTYQDTVTATITY